MRYSGVIIKFSVSGISGVGNNRIDNITGGHKTCVDRQMISVIALYNSGPMKIPGA